MLIFLLGSITWIIYLTLLFVGLNSSRKSLKFRGSLKEFIFDEPKDFSEKF